MLFLVVDERVSREGEYMKEGIGSAVVPSYRELVEQLDSAKKLKDELGKKITKLTRLVLDSPEAKESLNLLSNQGGERTQGGITFAKKKEYVWDEQELKKILGDLDPPPFLTVETRYKVNMAEYKKWLVDHDDTFYKNAMSTKLGDSSIKKINIETFRKSQEETNEC
jgi:hypothetical protein